MKSIADEVLTFRLDFSGARAGLDKPGAFTRAGAVEENLTARGHSFPEPLPEFLVAANVSWEIDIWKKLRNAQCAAYLRYLGTAEVGTMWRLA